MGNNCAGARESLHNGKEKTKELYNRAAENARLKAKAAKKKYSLTKMKLKGYKINSEEDPSETGKVSQFENRFALCNVGLDEFERRLTAFKEKEKTLKMSPEQVIELFKDNYFLEDIVEEESLTRKLLTHKVLETSKGVIFIPYLRLLGIMYCASTNKMAAEIFYDMVRD
jgi:hypothetical protein